LKIANLFPVQQQKSLNIKKEKPAMVKMVLAFLSKMVTRSQKIHIALL